MSSPAAVCKGSIALGTDRGRCSRCVDMAKEYAIGLRKARWSQMSIGDHLVLARSVRILIRELGFRGYQNVIREDA